MMRPALPPTYDQVLEARDRLRGVLERTPVVLAGNWLFKAEYGLPTGSFKVRGATVAIDAASRQGHTRVIAASAGNHGQGMGWAAKRMGVDATIVVPPECPQLKLDKMRALARVIVHDEPGYDAAEAAARTMAAQQGIPFISPFNDTWVMAGNGGTLALELIEQVPDLGTVILPVGGGGLFSGVASVVAQLRPEVRLVATQSEASPAFTRSLLDDTWHATWPPAETLAEGLEGGVGLTAVQLARQLGPELVVVSEDEIRSAMIDLHRMIGRPIEGSAAVVLAAMRSSAAETWPDRRVGILTGGNVGEETINRLAGN